MAFQTRLGDVVAEFAYTNTVTLTARFKNVPYSGKLQGIRVWIMPLLYLGHEPYFSTPWSGNLHLFAMVEECLFRKTNFGKVSIYETSTKRGKEYLGLGPSAKSRAPNLHCELAPNFATLTLTNLTLLNFGAVA